MKKIIKVNSMWKWEISFIIHLNNICNFKCHYCTAWKHRTSWSLDLNDIKEIIKSIKVITTKYKNRVINIDLNWWEPTLHKDLFTFLNEFLSFKEDNNIKNININITTNLYRITHYEKDIILLNGNKNFWFEISYHFLMYKDNINKFIDSINLLIKYNLIFKIKFLLPDKNETLESFIECKNKIFESTWLNESNCYYDLITVTNWVVSDSYLQEMLNYYYSNNSLALKDAKLEVQYDNWDKEFLDMHDIRTKWINKFKWFYCYYISKNIIEINVSHNKYITFWPCYAINSLKYNISDLVYLLSQDEKKVMCFEEYCDRWINLKKEYSNDYNIIKKIELIFKERFKDIINLELQDVWIILGKNIKLLFKYNDYYIYVYIEKQAGDKYLYVKDWVWFYFILKDKNNIILDIRSLENWIFASFLLKKIVEMLSIYKKLLFK